MNNRKMLKIAVILSFIMIPMVIISLLSTSNDTTSLPPCILNTYLGILCPGTGVTRAFRSLLHFDILTAMSYNLLFVLLLPLFVYYYMAVVINVLGNKNINLNILTGKKMKVSVAAVLVFMALRNIPFQPFSWLAP